MNRPANNPTGVLGIGAHVCYRPNSDAGWRDGIITDPCPDDPRAWLVKEPHALDADSVLWYDIRWVYHPRTTAIQASQWLASYGGGRDPEWPADYQPPAPPFTRVRPINGMELIPEQYGRAAA